MVQVVGNRSKLIQKERTHNKQVIYLSQVDKELLKAEEEERKLRQELEKAKEQESERKRQVRTTFLKSHRCQ